MHTSRRIVVSLAAALAALCCIAALAAPASAAQWRFETLDGATNGPNGRLDANVGAFNATTVWNNQPHVWFYDDTNNDLRHAWWSGAAWLFETLDGNCPTTTCANGSTNADVGSDTAATVWAGTPHVWYHDSTSFDLRHGWWTGSQWRFETLDGAGGTNGRIDANVGYDNVVTIWNNRPHVWHLDSTNEDLRHSWWTGRTWQHETLDGNCPAAKCLNGSANTRIRFGIAASVWNDQPHVWYLDFTNGDLRHGWWTGSQWRFETLDGAGGTNGRIDTEVGALPSSTVWNNEPHVWYRNSIDDDLRHAWWNGRAWFFETLDGNCPTATCANGATSAEVAAFSAVTVWAGAPHVWHWDATNGDQRHSWWTGSEWRHETLDGNSTAGGRLDAALGSSNAVTVWNNEPHIFYRDGTNTDLRHSWYG